MRIGLLHDFILVVFCVSLVVSAMPGVGEQGSLLRDPPDMKIVYSASTYLGDTFRLYLAEWPNHKPRLLTPKTVGDVQIGKYIAEPRFSPDGRKVLFRATSRLPGGKEPKVGGWYVGTDLWILDIEKNTAKPLTSGGDGYDDFSWSPDGRYVCAISHEGFAPIPPIDSIKQTEQNVYVWDTHTGERKLVREYVTTVAWSPDSKYLYCEGITGDEEPAILRVSRDGGKPEVIVKPGLWLGHPSPNGKMITFSEGGLSVKTLGAKTVRRFFKGEGPIVCVEHQWAPDSRRIAVEGMSSRGDGTMDTTLSILDITTGKVRSLGDIADLGEVKGWTRNGEWVVATRYTNQLDMGSQYLTAISTKTGKVVTLVDPERCSGIDWRELPRASGKK